MKNRLVLCVLAALLTLSVPAVAKEFLKFAGGPSGGTFQYFSNGMSIRLSDKLEGLKFSNQASRGSVENIRKVNSGRTHFGIAYSGDVYLARNGKLAGDKKKYTNVRTVAFLYKAPAQLAVLADSGIKSVKDLVGKKVALGGAGSGAAASAERYFRTIGLWDKLNKQFLGYSKAASAMKNKQVDAMWILAGYPTRALIELAATRKIRLLPLWEEAVKNKITSKHPYYQPHNIPANTYDGVTGETSSFFDSALWIVNKKVKDVHVNKSLKEIFSSEGLKYMVNVKSTAKQMGIKEGVVGIVTPLHQGAEKFWLANKVTVSGGAKAE